MYETKATGTTQADVYNNAVQPGNFTQQPVSNVGKKKDKKKIILAVLAVVLVIVIASAFKPAKNYENSNSLVANTTWIAGDGSEVIFTDERIDWYQNPDDHTDNYYSGEYEVYRGEEAVEYVTKELSEYYVTKDEVEELFDRSDLYDESNFVVFDIRYDKMVVSGEERDIEKPLVPWFGFVLEDDTYLDVANMNTSTYYAFTKQ
ncbi:MAG: hypothetical protein E7557_02750 [Ruminococcaceae bacterium]|nr:hypothetical protein [Oscillospiraceae bacterium]